jgi:transaldolase
MRQAIAKGDEYEASFREKTAAGKTGEALFFELALEDLRQAADLFPGAPGDPTRSTAEVSPRPAYDTTSTLASTSELYTAAGTSDPR